MTSYGTAVKAQAIGFCSSNTYQRLMLTVVGMTLFHDAAFASFLATTFIVLLLFHGHGDVLLNDSMLLIVPRK